MVVAFFSILQIKGKRSSVASDYLKEYWGVQYNTVCCVNLANLYLNQVQLLHAGHRD